MAARSSASARDAGAGAAGKARLREIRLTLSRLAPASSYLARAGGPGAYDKDDEVAWSIFDTRNETRRSGAKIPAKTVTALASRGLIERAPPRHPHPHDSYVLSDAGRAWLRRAEALAEPFLAQHQSRARRAEKFGGEAAITVTVNDAESPLAWLARRKGADGTPFLSAAQHQAGERLRGEFERAHMTSRVTSNWSDPVASSHRRRSGVPGRDAEISDAAIAAKARFFRALEYVGPELSGMLTRICCDLDGLEAAEKALSLPKRSGKVVLRMALDRLARHYGLLPPPADLRKVLFRDYRWGVEGYRPTID